MGKLPMPVKIVIGTLGYSVFRGMMKICHITPTVKNEDETLNVILKNKSSVARFGDGEFLWIFQERQDGNFERNSPELSKRLYEVLTTPQNNLMICIPNVFSGLKGLKTTSRTYWKGFFIKKGVKVLKLLDPSRVYYDTQFTRPYMDYADSTRNFKQKFLNLKKIWSNRNVLIVEGKKSRFGVASDLLVNAKSVKRILCPSENAFEKYDQIVNKAMEEAKNIDNVLVLASLGPAATILAYDLNKENIQCIDIGHLDVEYQWYRMKAKTKVAITGKYVNESEKKFTKELPSNILKKYHTEVIADIK